MDPNTQLIILATAPVLFLLIYIYRKDKVNKEPVKMLLKAFLAGCFCVIPAIVLETFLSAFTLQGPISGALYEGYIVAGFSEELCKLMLLYWVIWKNKNFDEYFDGVVYAVYVSLGFACVENISYIFQSEDFYSSLSTGAIRAVLSVPGHFLFGVIMGYYFSLAKFDRKKRAHNMTRALFVPILFHGTFDAILMVSGNLSNDSMGEGALFTGVLFVVFIIFDIKMWKTGLRRIKRMQELSQNNAFHNWESPLEHIDWNV